MKRPELEGLVRQPAGTGVVAGALRGERRFEFLDGGAATGVGGLELGVLEERHEVGAVELGIEGEIRRLVQDLAELEAGARAVPLLEQEPGRRRAQAGALGRIRVAGPELTVDRDRAHEIPFGIGLGRLRLARAGNGRVHRCRLTGRAVDEVFGLDADGRRILRGHRGRGENEEQNDEGSKAGRSARGWHRRESSKPGRRPGGPGEVSSAGSVAPPTACRGDHRDRT
ncbi:MAG: hypothetical protein R2862_07080 [Thermoanaerobaculia bacterium]